MNVRQSMASVIVVAAAVLHIASATGNCETNSGLESELDGILELLEKGLAASAVSESTALIKANPNCARGYSFRATAHMMEKRYDDALVDLRKSIQLDPYDSMPRNNLASILLEHKEYKSVIDELTESLKLIPENHKALYNRGVAHTSLRAWDDAIRDFDQYLELNPESAEAYSHRAMSRLQKKELTRAIQDSNKALVIDPNQPLALLTRAVAYWGTGEAKKALSDIQRGLILKPDSKQFLAMRTQVLSEHKPFREARFQIEQLSKAIDVAPQNSELYLLRGAHWNGLYEFDRAFSDFDKATELSPKDLEPYRQRVAAWIGQDKCQRAIDEADRMILIAPESSEPHVFCLSWTLSEIDELEYSSPPGDHDVPTQAVFPRAEGVDRSTAPS